MEHFNAIGANIAQMKYCKKIIFRILHRNSIAGNAIKTFMGKKVKQ